MHEIIIKWLPADLKQSEYIWTISTIQDSVGYSSHFLAVGKISIRYFGSLHLGFGRSCSLARGLLLVRAGGAGAGGLDHPGQVALGHLDNQGREQSKLVRVLCSVIYFKTFLLSFLLYGLSSCIQLSQPQLNSKVGFDAKMTLYQTLNKKKTMNNNYKNKNNKSRTTKTTTTHFNYNALIMTLF